jgi:hypothetical protein
MKKLYEYSKNEFSQNGEDGIIEHIFDVLNIKNGVLLEIGAWDGFYLSNTANVWSKNSKFKVVLIESTDNLNSNKLESEYDNVNCFVEMASIENGLDNMLDRSKFDINNNNFVLASIDIDGDDLNVTKSLGKYKPMILIVESNGNLIEKTNPVGSTVKELIDFGLTFGYEFIGMSGVLNESIGNTFFVRNDLKDKFEITKLEWLYRGVLVENGVPYEESIKF